MAEIKHLIPSPGLVVRDPATRAPLPPEGENKRMNTYWQRRVLAGDVTEGPARTASAPPAEEGE
jgi:hypothetical protein